LCLFEMLEELDFDENEFEGALPACVGCLPNLREIDIEDNKFTGTIPKEWGNLHKLIEFEIDGNELLAGCIPEGLPKDAEWCGDCWSTCPSYDPYCGAYDCKSCVEWTKDPEIGTSYENTRIKGERCPGEPNPPVCPWEIFKEEFEAKQAEEKELRRQQAQELQQRRQDAMEEQADEPSTITFLNEVRSVEEKPEEAVAEEPQPVVEAPEPVAEVSQPVVEAPEPVVEEELPAEETPEPNVEEELPAEEAPEPAAEEQESVLCTEETKRVTLDNEACVFPMKVMDQNHCDCVEHNEESWCTIADGTWKKCAPAPPTLN